MKTCYLLPLFIESKHLEVPILELLRQIIAFVYTIYQDMYIISIWTQITIIFQIYGGRRLFVYSIIEHRWNK